MTALPANSDNNTPLRKVEIEQSTVKLVRCRPFSDVYESELDGLPVCVELVRWPEDLTNADGVGMVHEVGFIPVGDVYSRCYLEHSTENKERTRAMVHSRTRQK